MIRRLNLSKYISMHETISCFVVHSPKFKMLISGQEAGKYVDSFMNINQLSWPRHVLQGHWETRNWHRT
jgi:hypothetical protein